jgi:uncharacterized membrane protein YsdA (DUF1294 family)/cold shock CspA family protein
MNPNPTRTGRIIEWNASKGFGFLDDGRHRIFVHIRDFAERRKVPEPGDVITFTIGEDFTGRTCAKDAVLAGPAGRIRIWHLLSLFLLFIAPAHAAHRLSAQFPLPLLVGVPAVVSLITYFAYWRDKQQARTGNWRTAESTLHLLEAAGGWPGAFIAQCRLRHKSSKRSYLLVFWFIVASHQLLAADYALDWRIANQAATLIRSISATGASHSVAHLGTYYGKPYTTATRL